jgi:hypothetical protein
VFLLAAIFLNWSRYILDGQLLILVQITNKVVVKEAGLEKPIILFLAVAAAVVATMLMVGFRLLAKVSYQAMAVMEAIRAQELMAHFMVAAAVLEGQVQVLVVQGQ